MFSYTTIFLVYMKSNLKFTGVLCVNLYQKIHI